MIPPMVAATCSTPMTLTTVVGLHKHAATQQYYPASLAKTLVRKADGSLEAQAADSAKFRFIRAWEKPFTDLQSFGSLLTEAMQKGHAVIHGAIIPGVDTNCMRRLTVAQPDAPATIRDRLCPYIVLDIDQLPLPAGYSVQKDPDAVVMFAKDNLPPELRDVSFFFHHSHSAGTKPFVKLHLAFMLEKPMSCRDLEWWVRRQNEILGMPLFDPAPYSPNDYIFLGNPKIAAGASDPIPPGKRFGIIKGQRDKALLDLPADWRPSGQRRSRGQQGDVRQFTGVGLPGVAAALARLGDECHGAILDAAHAAFRGKGLAVDDDALAARIENALDAADWDYGIHSDAYLDSERSNIRRVVEWRRDVERAAIEKLPHALPLPRFGTAKEASSELGKTLDDYLQRCVDWKKQRGRDEAGEKSPAPLMAIRATTGIGKTRGIVDRLFASDFRSILYVAPTHAVLKEIHEELERKLADLPASQQKEWELFHIYGRTHRDSKTRQPTMCQKADLAQEVLRCGGDVSKTLCRNEAGKRCEFYDDCPFIAQSRALTAAQENFGQRSITLITTDTLSHRLPSGVRQPDFVVIDEAFWNSLASGQTGERNDNLKLETMRGVKWEVLLSEKEEKCVVSQEVCPTQSAKLQQEWTQFVGLLETCGTNVDHCGFFPVKKLKGHDWGELLRLLRDCRVDVDLAVRGAHSDTKLRETLAKIAEINSRVWLYRALIKAMRVEAEKTNANLTGMVAIKEGHVTFRRAHEPTALGGDEKRGRIPTLFLDADLDPELVRRWWPGLKDDEVVDVTCNWSEHVKVVQIIGNRFSKNWCLGSKDDQDKAKRHQADLHHFIRYAMAINDADPSETMVVSYKDLIEQLGQMTGDALYAIPSDPDTPRSVGWFNALAGLDRWKGVRVGFVIGRPQATPQDYEDLARAIWGHEDRDWSTVEPDQQGFRLAPLERLRLHVRDGALPVAIHTTTLPDPYADKIHRAVTWAQVMQADGRIRPVHRTAADPCVLFILGEVPRGIPVDAVLHWDDAKVTRLDQGVLKAMRVGGVVPSSAGALAKFAPEIWRDAKAVENDCRLQQDDDSVMVDLRNKLAEAISKVHHLQFRSKQEKAPLDAMSRSHSVQRGLLSNHAATALSSPVVRLDGLEGEARLVGQPGSPLKWMRTPVIKPMQLSEALLSAFGETLQKIRIEENDWMPISTLQAREEELKNGRLQERAAKAHAAWIKWGAVQPPPYDGVRPLSKAQEIRVARLEKEIAGVKARSPGQVATLLQLVAQQMLLRTGGTRLAA